MSEFKKVEPWYEPTDLFREDDTFKCEMSRTDHGFLSGIIKQIRPHKVLEVGVAEGGTTAVIVKSLQMLNLECEMFSVDLSDKLFCDKNFETGYVFKKQEKPENIKHTFLFGKTIAGQIEEIGGEIDLAILDTTHKIPGEILDFLSVLPYLSDDGMVLLHDVNLYYDRAMSKEKKRIQLASQSIATKVLFTSVVADKYYNYDNFLDNNIAAFKINNNTYKFSLDLFTALSLPWAYKVDEFLINEYKQLFSKHYCEQCMDMYDVAVNMNDSISKNMDKYGKDINWQFPFESIPYGSRIVLYGAGYVGKEIFSLLKSLNYAKIVCVVDINYRKYQDMDINDMKIQKPEILLESDFDYILVTVESLSVFKEIERYIIQNNLNCGKQIIGPINRC